MRIYMFIHIHIAVQRLTVEKTLMSRNPFSNLR